MTSGFNVGFGYRLALPVAPDSLPARSSQVAQTQAVSYDSPSVRVFDATP